MEKLCTSNASTLGSNPSGSSKALGAMVAHRTHNAKDIGSVPIGPTMESDKKRYDISCRSSMEEPLTFNQEDDGSVPSGSTKYSDLAQG